MIGMTFITFVFFYLLNDDFSLKGNIKYIFLYIIIPLFILFLINLVHSINFHKKSTNGLNKLFIRRKFDYHKYNKKI